MLTEYPGLHKPDQTRQVSRHEVGTKQNTVLYSHPVEAVVPVDAVEAWASAHVVHSALPVADFHVPMALRNRNRSTKSASSTSTGATNCDAVVCLSLTKPCRRHHPAPSSLGSAHARIEHEMELSEKGAAQVD